MKKKTVINTMILICIPVALICVIMPLTEFTGVTEEDALFYIEQLDYPLWPTDLDIEISDFVNNEMTVYINNTGSVDSYRPTAKLQYPDGLEFWIYDGALSHKFDRDYSYLTLDEDGELRERLHPNGSWSFNIRIRGNGNGTCKLTVSEEVLGGWGWRGNCMYGEITHINIDEVIADEFEFEVRT